MAGSSFTRVQWPFSPAENSISKSYIHTFAHNHQGVSWKYHHLGIIFANALPRCSVCWYAPLVPRDSICWYTHYLLIHFLGRIFADTLAWDKICWSDRGYLLTHSLRIWFADTLSLNIFVLCYVKNRMNSRMNSTMWLKTEDVKKLGSSASSRLFLPQELGSVSSTCLVKAT